MKLLAANRANQYVLFFWLSFTVVIILNLLVWLYLQQVEKRFKDELQGRLLNINQILSRLINEYHEDADLNLLLPDQRQSIEYLFYQQFIDEIRLKSQLQSILLISPQGDILISSPEMIARQSKTSIANSDPFREALAGKQVVSQVEEIAGERFISAFAPIENMDGFAVAVLSIEAKAGYVEVLTNLKKRLLLFSSLNLILILLIAFFLLRMIKRSLNYQAEIKERERLAQLGTMAATVAHELRNPLSIIEATNDVIKKKYSRNEDEIFSYIPQEVKRLSLLIDDFLKLARAPKLSIGKLDLTVLTERLKMSLSAVELRRFQINLLPAVAEFYTDVNILEQALLNVLRNAMQATASGGHVFLQFSSQKRRRLHIVVRDEGCGILQETLPHIFDPFFTTREKGTGLGLSITKRLIEHLQGEISIHSGEGQGTTVTLRLVDLSRLKERVA